MLEEYVFRLFFLLCALLIKPYFIMNIDLSLDALKYYIFVAKYFLLISTSKYRC